MVNLLDKHKHPRTIPQPKQSPTPQRGAEHRTPVPNRSTVTGTHINSNHTVPITVHTVTVSFQSWPLPPCSPRLFCFGRCRLSVVGVRLPVPRQDPPVSPPRRGALVYIYWISDIFCSICEADRYRICGVRSYGHCGGLFCPIWDVFLFYVRL